MTWTIPFTPAGVSVPAKPVQFETVNPPSTAVTTKVQPVPASKGTRGAAADDRRNMGQGANQHPMHAAKPERAEPNSVIQAQTQQPANPSAQTVTLFDSAATAPAEEWKQRPDKLDRYAPPDPLPTAPILKHKARAVTG